MKSLKEKVLDRFGEFGIEGEQKTLLLALLDILKVHDVATYRHCLRVGLKGVEVAVFLDIDPRPLFYAGLLHDFGKLGVKTKTLRKVNFSESDYAEVRQHSMLGYIVLRALYPFSADILVRHHSSQALPYPNVLPKTRFDEELIAKYARLLALIDFHDALTTRKNKKFNIDRRDRKRVEELMIGQNESQAALIEDLFEAGIF